MMSKLLLNTFTYLVPDHSTNLNSTKSACLFWSPICESLSRVSHLLAHSLLCPSVDRQILIVLLTVLITVCKYHKIPPYMEKTFEGSNLCSFFFNLTTNCRSSQPGQPFVSLIVDKHIWPSICHSFWHIY